MIKQLGEQDASFLYLETPETPQHVGSVSLVELPPGFEGDFYETYKAHVASRVHLIPLLFNKLVQLPFDIDHPFWIEDDQLDIDYHVRHQTLPRPGRLSQLEELIGRLHSNFLDRSRPLWEFYVIDGLESGRVAIYTKVHHAAMDGASSQLLINAMYDPTPKPREVPPPARKPGEKHKAKIEELLRGVAGHFVRQEIRALQAMPDALKAWANLVLPDAQTLRWGKPALPPLRTPRTPFNVAITSQRSYAMRTLPLSRLKRLAKQAGVKLNDVVLALCAGALRSYLNDHHALPKTPMTAMVPVSLHGPGAPDASNRNTAVLCSLATQLANPLKRLQAIHESMDDQKRLLSNIRNALLPDLGFIGSGTLMRGMVDLYRRAKLSERLPLLSNLVISNVPGPPAPLYIAGARILSFNPCSIPFHGSAVNITVESYNDSLDFGLIACRRTVPDLAQLADHLPGAMVELEQAIARRDVPRASTAARAQPVVPRKAVAPHAGKTAARTAPAKAVRKRIAAQPAASPARQRPRRAPRKASIPTGETKSAP